MTDAARISSLVLDKLIGQHGCTDFHDHMTLDTWEWPQGVALYAMMKLYRSTGDSAILEKLKNWYDAQIEKGLPSLNINTTAPMLCLTFLYEETGTASYLDLIASWAEQVMTKLPRTSEGGFQHRTSDDVNEQQLWDDTLYMTVLFLFRAGVVLGREDYKNEAKYQFLLHIKYLHSTENHLWYHGYCFIGSHHFANAYWCRGNSWFTACALDFCEWLPEGDPVRRMVENTFIAQCEALKKYQDENGLWRTLIDDPASYPETSGSAAIAYGIKKGLRLGLLRQDEFGPCAEKAVQGVLSQVGPDGAVNGVSYGTPMGMDLDFYRNIPIRQTAYGQGLVFLMLTEVMS